MSQLDYRNAKQPADVVQRRPLDGPWFTILFASIAVGIGMTIFAPVGDTPPAASSATPVIEPTTLPTTGESIQPTASPTTAPVP
ncbi:MAG: hypothetical protein WBD40_22190 [Tepidisphaeraceae bacterium]